MALPITTRLEDLFETWRREADIPEDHFHKDGIVDEPTWASAKLKLCYLMKEPNNPPKEGWEGAFDFCAWWRDDPIKGAFTARIAEWTYGILNGFPPYDEAWEADEGRAIQDIRRHIALVNVKKTGGGGFTDIGAFMQDLGTSEEHRRSIAGLVREQLRIIAPHVVIMGLSRPELRTMLFWDVDWKPSGYNLDVGLWEGRVLIDFYHPSSRNAPAAAYCLLEKVMGSAAYLELMEAGKVERQGEEKGAV